MEMLKPCPFCGEQVRMLYYKYMNNSCIQHGHIVCDQCCIGIFKWSDIRAETRNETLREERAIKLWNTRT